MSAVRPDPTGRPQGRRIPRRRRGGLLLEMLLALAIFATAATFAFAALRNARAGLDRAQRLATATEIAASRLAELEAGTIGASGLRDAGDGIERLGSEDFRANDFSVGGGDDAPGPFDRWRIEVEVERSDYAGLSLVTVIVEEVDEAFSGFEGTGGADSGMRPPGASGDDAIDADPPIRVVVRQLLRLRDEAGDGDGFEADDLLDGPPAGSASGTATGTPRAVSGDGP